MKEKSPIPVILLSAVLFFVSLLPFLGDPPIGGSSEAREAQVVSVIGRSGEIILPLRNGIVPSKPPLYHWIAATVSSLAGRAEDPPPFLPRLVSLLFGAGVIFFTVLITRNLSRLSGADSTVIRSDSCVAALVLALTYGFFSMAERAMVDMTFTFFVVSGVAVLLGRISRTANGFLFSPRISDWLIFYSLTGLAILTRGPVGLLSGLLALSAIWALVGGRGAIFSFARSAPFFCVSLLIALPWYFIAYQKGGAAFLERHLFIENLNRLIGEETPKPFWFYIPQVISNALPWSLLLIAAFLPRFKSWRATIFRQTPVVAPLAAFLVGLIFFSLSGGKRASYLLPLYPFLAIVVALWLRPFFQQHILQSLTARKISKTLVLILCSLGIAFSLVLLLAGKFISPDQMVPVTIEIVLFKLAVFCLLMVVLLRTVVRKYTGGSELIMTAVLFSSVLFALIQTGQAIKEELRGYRLFAQKATEVIPVSATVAAVKGQYDEYFDPLFYYLHRDVFLYLPQDSGKINTDYLFIRKSVLAEQQPALTEYNTLSCLVRPFSRHRRQPPDEICLMKAKPLR